MTGPDRKGQRRLSALPRAIVVLGLCLASLTAGAQVVESCFSCHDLGPDFPPERLLAGSHGGDLDGTANPRGCLTCHGDSEDHIAAPNLNSPDVSFGSRWGSSPGEQDAACLQCHETDVARHWQHALHMLNNLTCITCHDIHSSEDSVLVPEQQAQVCTTCHKAQKRGIHGTGSAQRSDPPCSSCHNPHNHESAGPQMLANDSAGCRYCHKVEDAAENASFSNKANNYHRVMGEPGHSCLECHRGIAHAAADEVTALKPTAVRSRTVGLFYPGATTAQWLTGRHPGSQALRQGRPCGTCHRGEEAALGASLAPDEAISHRDMTVAFGVENNMPVLNLSWTGGPDDTAVSLMWAATGDNPYFDRGGCFAACHDELDGMPGDRGTDVAKYLLAESREPDHEEGETGAAGELPVQPPSPTQWRMDLASGDIQLRRLAEGSDWTALTAGAKRNRRYLDGEWHVSIPLDPEGGAGRLALTEDRRYTFGIALHGEGNEGHRHWVSLPLNVGYRDGDTLFRVAP